MNVINLMESEIITVILKSSVRRSIIRSPQQTYIMCLYLASRFDTVFRTRVQYFSENRFTNVIIQDELGI